MGRRMMMCLTTAVLLSGCSASNQPQSQEKSQGRPETKSLEAATAVGYDGKALRKGVDSTLNKNDDHNAGLDKELKAGAEGQQKP